MIRYLAVAFGLLVVAAGLIVLPVLGLGFISPYVVVPLLGESWIPTGQIMGALALMCAAQALSTPIQEVPTLFRRQELRLLVDLVRAVFVFGPLLIGAHLGLDPLQVIYMMAAGGATGYALGIIVALFLLNGPGGARTSGAPINGPV